MASRTGGGRFRVDGEALTIQPSLCGCALRCDFLPGWIGAAWRLRSRRGSEKLVIVMDLFVSSSVVEA